MFSKAKEDNLLPLDNSAIIYPPTVARYNTHVFRLSFDLNIEVNPKRLLLALENIIERFPYYKVSLHQGFFWYYFLPNNRPLEVYPEVSYPCGYIHPKKGANRYLFKVFYTKNRIAVEFFHALTDGTGGLTFLKSLTAEYLRLSGIEVDSDPQILLPTEKVPLEEIEDSFEKFYKPLKSVFGTEQKAFHLSKGTLTDDVLSISGKIKIEQLKEISKKYNVTITEFLVSELIFALQKIQSGQVKKEKNNKPIRVSVPVNIRRHFDSTSLRNFTLFVVIGVDPSLGLWSFEEILEQVMHQLRGGINSKTLSRQVARNVAGRRHILIRWAPNIFKKPFMKLLSDSYGDSIFSTTLSNLGAVSFPKGMKEVVKRGDFYLSPSKKNKVSLAAIGVKEHLIINFTSILSDNTTFEKEVFRSLVEKGIEVEISSNREE